MGCTCKKSRSLGSDKKEGTGAEIGRVKAQCDDEEGKKKYIFFHQIYTLNDLETLDKGHTWICRLYVVFS
ncbi:hypothetical protein MASR2M78_00720 [Treponema sp.]